jgi:uncharacterized membrane protein
MEQPDKQAELAKSKGFANTFMTHNTTIIAILLAIAAMISNQFEEREQAAYDAEQAIEDKREAINEDIRNYDEEIQELEVKEDTASAKYQSLVAVYNIRVDSLTRSENDQEKQQEETTKILAHAKDQSKKSDTASILFQISVLLSSIGFTNKNKFLMYLATVLTAVGVIYILLMII